jgi:hypothetical protein
MCLTFSLAYKMQLRCELKPNSHGEREKDLQVKTRKKQTCTGNKTERREGIEYQTPSDCISVLLLATVLVYYYWLLY